LLLVEAMRRTVGLGLFLASLTSTPARADARALAREVLKREIAAMLEAITVAQAPAVRASGPQSVWARETPTNHAAWKDGVDAHGAAIALAEPEDDPAPAPAPTTVHTIGGGAGVADLDDFDHGLTRLHRPHLPRALTARANVPRVPPDAVRRIVHENFGGLRLCYDSGLRRNPDLSGRVVVKFTIDSTGTVAVASDGGSDLADVQVVACVVRSFANLTFPAAERGGVTVMYPLVFTPGPVGIAP
jgi:hypothetical protein